MFLHSVGLPNGVQRVSCAGQADVDVTPNSEEVAAVKHVDLQVCQVSGRGELPGCAGRGEEGQATGAAEGCGRGAWVQCGHAAPNGEVEGVDCC